MSKINTVGIRNNGVAILKELKKMVSGYVNYVNGISQMKEKGMYSSEYIEKKTSEYKEVLQVISNNTQAVIFEKLEVIKEAINENNQVFDFSDTELANCVSLMQASANKVPDEVMRKMAKRFYGNRMALQTLKELAPDAYKNIFSEGIVEPDSEIENISDMVYRFTAKPFENIFMLPIMKNDFVKLLNRCGVELDENEVDLGEDYYSLVNLQMRAAAGLGAEV